MTMTVRLSQKVEQDLAEYCVKRHITKSEAVKNALALLLQARETIPNQLHPFIGGDAGDGSDVSGNIKTALQQRFRTIE